MAFIRVLLLGLLIFVTSIGISLAEEVTEGLKVSDVAAFLNSAEQLEPLAEEMEAKEIPHFFEVRPLNMTAEGVPSHLKATQNMKEDHPEYYKRMEDTILAHFFQETHYYRSVEDWAKMADRVMLAFYTSRSDGGGRKFEEMSAKAAPLIAISKMNPEAAKQMQGVLDMLESFSKVTDADKQVVREFHQQLTIHFGAYPQE